MNAPNINNQPNAAEPVGRTRDVHQRMRNERAARAEETEETQRVLPENEAAEQGAVRPARDVFETTEERELVREMAELAVNTEEAPRQEAISRARERISEGYYNRVTVQENVALRLINTDRTR